MAKTAAKTRLNLEMTVKVKENLERLREQTDAQSFTEVIRRALALYRSLLDYKNTGAQIILRTKDGDRDVFLT